MPWCAVGRSSTLSTCTGGGWSTTPATPRASPPSRCSRHRRLCPHSACRLRHPRRAPSPMRRRQSAVRRRPGSSWTWARSSSTTSGLSTRILVLRARWASRMRPLGVVDLGAPILDDQRALDTRMRVGQRQPIEDEDQAFHEALAEFKRGIEANLDADDFQSHYDLGIAFKEMGLMDEAIAQFQKALRSPEGRLKTSEQLGSAFFEKGQYAICEAVLRRAVDGLPGADDEKIGLLYWLGRALEAQERGREALPLYERALAVDIRFLDLGPRVTRLGAKASR